MKTGNISFGSTYAIKYDYIRDYKARFLEDRNYKAKNHNVDKFITDFDRFYKEKEDVESLNPARKLFFININDKKDKKLENLARELNIEFKKVKQKEMHGTKIVSMGLGANITDIFKNIDYVIIDHELKKDEEEARKREYWRCDD